MADLWWWWFSSSSSSLGCSCSAAVVAPGSGIVAKLSTRSGSRAEGSAEGLTRLSGTVWGV